MKSRAAQFQFAQLDVRGACPGLGEFFPTVKHFLRRTQRRPIRIIQTFPDALRSRPNFLWLIQNDDRLLVQIEQRCSAGPHQRSKQFPARKRLARQRQVAH